MVPMSVPRRDESDYTALASSTAIVAEGKYCEVAMAGDDGREVVKIDDLADDRAKRRVFLSLAEGSER
jgi:hypothetical protein